MSTTPYKRRIVERKLRSRLESAGAVVIEGPKACGKTATAETMAASAVRLDVDEQARRAAEIEPALVLDGVAPRLTPSPWRRSLKSLAFRMPCRPMLRMFQMLVLNRGFLDGPAGIVYARMMASYESMIDVHRSRLRSRIDA